MKARVQSVSVQTGITDGRWIEIISGLSGGEQVIVVGKQKVVEGAPAKTSPFKLPDATPAKQNFERRSAGHEPPRRIGYG